MKIINLPAGLDTNVTHNYGLNAFKLHGLPTPRPGTVLGLLGANGIGKSTALNILSGYFSELSYACITTTVHLRFVHRYLICVLALLLTPGTW